MAAAWNPSFEGLAAEVEPVLEDRLRIEAELPEKRGHIAMVAPFVQQEMGDQLAAAVRDLLAVDVQPWGSFIYFSDPDGNTWAVQQIPDRA